MPEAYRFVNRPRPIRPRQEHTVDIDRTLAIKLATYCHLNHVTPNDVFASLLHEKLKDYTADVGVCYAVLRDDMSFDDDTLNTSLVHAILSATGHGVAAFNGRPTRSAHIIHSVTGRDLEYLALYVLARKLFTMIADPRLSAVPKRAAAETLLPLFFLFTKDDAPSVDDVLAVGARELRFGGKLNRHAAFAGPWLAMLTLAQAWGDRSARKYAALQDVLLMCHAHWKALRNLDLSVPAHVNIEAMRQRCFGDSVPGSDDPKLTPYGVVWGRKRTAPRKPSVAGSRYFP